MNVLNSESDLGFAIIFSAIMLMASVKTGLKFWKKVQRTYTDHLQKLEMLKTGASADEIVRSLLSRAFENRERSSSK